MNSFLRTDQITFDDQNNTITINKITDNMQDDSAAFEGWSLLLKVSGEYKTVTLRFQSLNDYSIFDFKKLNKMELHYTRFLYRIMKFRNEMHSWFFIHPENQEEIKLFESKFLETVKINNRPESYSTFSKKPKKEHILEKSIVNKLLLLNTEPEENMGFFDQLPVSVFSKDVKDENRIFSKGFIDLWSLNSNNEINIYELKEPDNKHIGIISELFFYANLISDLISGTNNWKLNSKQSKYRGYNAILQANKKRINAYFLINKLHPAIKNYKNEIIDILNSSEKIKYGIMTYEIEENWEKDLTNKLKILYQQE